MDEIVEILVSHGAASGSAAGAIETLDVLSLSLPMVSVTRVDAQFRLAEEEIQIPWPENCCTTRPVPSEEELNERRAQARGNNLVMMALRLVFNGAAEGEAVTQEVQEKLCKEVEIQKQLWIAAKELPQGWDIKLTEHGRTYFVDQHKVDAPE